MSQEKSDEIQKKVDVKRKDYEKIQQVSNQLNNIIDEIENRTAQQMELVCSKLRLKVNPAYHAPEKKRQRGILRSLAKKFMGNNRR